MEGLDGLYDIVLFRGKKYTIFHNYHNGNYEIRSLNATLVEYVLVPESELQIIVNTFPSMDIVVNVLTIVTGLFEDQEFAIDNLETAFFQKN